MGEVCELWELEASIVEASAGVYRVTGTVRHRASYPSLPFPLGVHAVPAEPPQGPFETADPMGTVASMVAQLRARAGAADDRRLTRLTLQLPPTLEGNDWEGRVAPVLVVRREAPANAVRSQQRRSALRLPLEVDVVDFSGATVGELYRDGHLRMVRGTGIRTVEGWPGPKETSIVHVATMASRALPMLWRRPVQPRLLVLQTDTVVPRPLVQASSGPGAILEVAPNFEFTRLFYRKLLHDWPIDRSADFARRHSGVGRYRLWGNGDERLPLLSTALLESAQSVRAAAPLPAQHGLTGRTFRGGTRTTRSGPRGAPVRAPSRADAVTSDLKTRLDAIAKTRAEAVEAALGVVTQRGIDFTQEAGGVRTVVEIQRRIDHAAAVATARAALDIGSGDYIPDAMGRVTSVWLQDEGTRRDVVKTESLVRGRGYLLAVRIGHPVAEGRVNIVFPEEALIEAFKHQDQVELDVVVFSPAEDFALSATRVKLHLPRVGDSDPVAIPLRTLRTGACRLRTCIYHGTRLLQSAWLEARVVEQDGATADASETPSIRSALDYAATGDFSLLESLREPEASIVINDAADGTHWLGVYAPNAGTLLGDLNVKLFTVSDDALRASVGLVQDQLTKVATYGNAYRFASDDPTPEDWQQRERMLVALARDGRRMCRTLLGDYLRPIVKDVARPGVLAIDRCRGDGAGVPWAVFYDYGLDTALPEAQQSVCPVFSKQAREGSDHLDDPVACRAQADCPLEKPDAQKRIVCPFGFWGVRHQLEQPLHHIARAPADGGGTVKIDRAAAAVHIPRGAAPKMRVACGRYQFADADTHPEELKPLLDVETRSQRDDILQLITSGGFPIVYFFCHGKMVEKDFVLQVGPNHPPEYIGADTLGDTFEWEQPQPLVFLNGCDTVAFDSEAINDLTTMFRACGASGVIGTEFSVPRPLARAVGKQVLEHLAKGETLGRAFLTVRRGLLRDMNPLGLAYSAYASAWLHFAADGDCLHCNADVQA